MPPSRGRCPTWASYKPFPVVFHDQAAGEGEAVNPYARDEKLARVWIKPGTPGLIHRIGGIEKNVGTGHIDYAPENHQAMTDMRADKVLGVADSIRDQEVCLGDAGRQARRGRLGLDLRPDPPGGAPRAAQGARRQPHPHPPHLAAAEQSGRSAASSTTGSSCPR